ncbi:uncharacterized protein SPPG_04747 [Spizellomyces punctatus DAOM BR117]|uniref:Ska2 N-terminal domain-containing protein n=1 Tax=Spizellomyces punctatus (strain DAOM BR117) TaxID=645134 RepID=A0A0L0HG08_SPIPD|nr:hypothetical protein, variant [Spizellomyces punctatus DAOM BR117]XP_016608465.1 uncharacterized protein SPPG_04747 [Spizellomyces punctatus DAOM BR117]KND00425.1 hypothetical protein, variant [Spizellomyces punctatus DAOM BR117]KND00426.1 hypothetical protein SPPG_04747 [Spizellomyces punctatus DAOM BR117]|eukprot:XP_016608464.1 hypothetical protein, variant [Spizellomyces punctatus DAOM BR117]
MEPVVRALRGGIEKLDEDLTFLEGKLDAEFSAPARSSSRQRQPADVPSPTKLLRTIERLEKDIVALQSNAEKVTQAKKWFVEETHRKLAINAELLERLSFGVQVEPDDETAGSKERFDHLAAAFSAAH